MAIFSENGKTKSIDSNKFIADLERFQLPEGADSTVRALLEEVELGISDPMTVELFFREEKNQSNLTVVLALG